MDSFPQNLLSLVKIFRKECRKLSECERTTVYGANDMLLGLQLAMAEVNKEDYGDFTVSLSDLMMTWKYLLHEKLDLTSEGETAPEKYDDIRKCYDSILMNSNVLDLIDVYQKCVKQSSEYEISKIISKEQLLEFISGPSVFSEDDALLPAVPSTPSRTKLQTNSKLPLVVKRLICAYVNLLVNSKNDLALAHILNIPDRGLGRDAFTDLKHSARSKQTSLFLAATSFIRALELGGKGYAPLESDPLRKHIKGLHDFVHFTDKLEEILGEIPDPCVAGNRILSAIKMRLLKGRSSGDPLSLAIEEAVLELDLRIKNIINVQHEAANANTTGMSPARPKSYAINHSTAYCGRDTVKTLLALLDEDATSPPSRNKADLLYGNDSALILGEDGILTLFRSPEQSSDSSPKSLRHRVQKNISEGKAKVKQTLIRSQFACTYKEDMVPVDRKLKEFPSLAHISSCIHPAPQNTPLIVFDEEIPTENLDSSVRRPTLGTHFGNVQQKGNTNKKDSGAVSGQPGTKSLKRKQVELNSENAVCNNENEPPQKKVITGHKSSNRPQHKLDSRRAAPGKSCKSAARNKLIAGQAKLTNFFRL